MTLTEAYIEHLHDLLGFLSDRRIRRMFGGAGIFSGELMFAVVVDDLLYFKVDALNRPDYEKAKASPYRYWAKGKARTMSFWTVPEDVLEDPDAMQHWTQKALAAAQRAADSGTTRQRS